MGFSIAEIVESKGYKAFMTKLYGWGASVVIVGALFKIMHFPGAGPMLVVGLGVEALIFFMSAFEPLHPQPDWSLVYPELAGLTDEDEEALAEDPKLSQKKSALEKFDEMIESAEITPQLFEKLGEGLKKMNETTEKLADVSDATVATNNYVANFEKASEKVNEFAESYGASATKLNQTSEALSETYIKSSETVMSSSQKFAETVAGSGEKISEIVSNAGNELAESYKKLTQAMNEEFESSTTGNKTYGEQLEIMTKNLTALNAVYELQLQSSNEHLEASKELYGGLDEMMKSLKDSATEAETYRQEVSKLSKNLGALNTIYGNMLTAMNVNINQ